MPGMAASLLRNASAWPRSVSRSSPKILMAICERTPDSMWSMRCEMGWPMEIAAGRFASRARMSAADLAHRAGQLARRLQSHVELADVHAFRMLVELGAAAAAPDVRDFGHLLDQHFRLARQRRGLGQRDARVQAHADEQRALVEGRQERRREEGHRGERDQHRDAAGHDGAPGSVEHLLQAARDSGAFNQAEQPRVAMVERLHAAAAGSTTAPASPSPTRPGWPASRR